MQVFRSLYYRLKQQLLTKTVYRISLMLHQFAFMSQQKDAELSVEGRVAVGYVSSQNLLLRLNYLKN